MNAYDKIYLLYFETVTGKISPDDQERICRELADNEEFRLIWKKLIEEGKEKRLAEFHKQLDETTALQQLKDKIRLKQQSEATNRVPEIFGKEEGSSDRKVGAGLPDTDKRTPLESLTDSETTSVRETNPDLVIGDTIDPSDGLSDATRIYDEQIQNGRKMHHYPYLGWKLAAAIIIVLGLVTAIFWPYWLTTLTNKTEIATAINKNKKQIQLQLASGKTVAILADKTDSVVRVGNGEIAFNTDKMTFKAADTAQNLLVIPKGRFYHITLSDGTNVTLNAATKLRFPFRFQGATREVYLDGEAYFSVAKDADHPFIVHTPLTRIRVLGTKFNVNTYQSGKVMTALVEGSVMTKANNNADADLALVPGKEAFYEKGSGFKVMHFDADNVLSWMDGVYYFHNMPMTELAMEISRYFGVNVAIDNANLQKRSVTGMMDRSNLPELLSDLSEIAGVRYYYSDKQLHLQ